MRLFRWRPEHGWRAFVTELVVVVLGVLIALGAEQTISGLRRQGDLNSLRSALREELSDNLASYNYRFGQQACLANRLTELKALRGRVLVGEAVAMAGEVGRPPSASLRTSVWSARNSEVMDAMPLDERIAYSYIYDELGFNFGLMSEEREAWRMLARLNGIPRLNEDDARTLGEATFRAEAIDGALRSNASDIRARLARLGIRPSESMKRLLGDDEGSLCKPLSR